jgi:signal transduction histidine kinase
MPGATKGQRGAGLTITVPDGRRLHITVTDHGPGLGPWTAGVGLASMRERVEQVGGTLQIRTGQPGTSVIADIPIPSRRAAQGRTRWPR